MSSFRRTLEKSVALSLILAAGAAGIGTLAGTATSAYAYIPPSWFIVKKMASKRTGLKSVRVVSQVIGYDGGKPNGLRFKAVTIYNPRTQTMKSEALDSTGKQLYGMKTQGDAVPLTLRVLFDPNSKDLIASLKRVGVPVHLAEEPGQDLTSLHRWDGSIAWVMGASKDNKGPQFWIEKDTFLPVRLMIGDQDYQFTKYRYSLDLPYPRSITEADSDGVVQIEEDLTRVQSNPSRKAQLFSVGNGLTPAGDSSAVKDLIQKYYAGLR